MNLHTPKPQVYVFVTTDGHADFMVTSGEVDIVYVNWEKLDGNYFSDYQPEDFLSDWRELARITDPTIRQAERHGYLSNFSDKTHYIRANRQQDAQREVEQRLKAIERARKLLREAGELS